MANTKKLSKNRKSIAFADHMDCLNIPSPTPNLEVQKESKLFMKSLDSLMGRGQSKKLPNSATMQKWLKAQRDLPSSTQLHDDLELPARLKFNDSADFSTHPSYSKIRSHYHLVCADRYRAARDKYEKTFQREINQLINQKPMVLDQYFTKLPLQYTTLWPPLHSRREIELFKRTFFQLNAKQKKHLNYLMNTKFV